MTKLPPVLLVFVSLAVGQTRPEKEMTVAPGAKGEMVLHIASPRRGHLIDVLVSNRAVHVTLVLPDGQEVTAQNAEQLGCSWDTEPSEKAATGERDYKTFLLRGAGQHALIGLKDPVPGGDYRIRVDAKDVAAPTKVAAARVELADVIMATRRAIPGVKIAKPVKLPAGSTSGRLALTPSQSAGQWLLDIAVTDPHVKVSLQLPDGSQVTRANAKAHGIEWTPAKWPPEDEGDDFGFGAMIMMGMMLPVEGNHQLISFPTGALKSGQYVMRFDAAESKRESEASAMFFPMKAVEKEFEDSFNPPPRRGETRAISYAEKEHGQYYAGDSVNLNFGLEGEGVREPLEITTHVTFQKKPDLPEQPVNLPVSFIRQTDGSYRSVLVLPEGGTYHIAATIQGAQVSGRKFSTNAAWELYSRSLVARLTKVTERAVDSDGNGRPDRLDFTAHVEVFTPGKYELSAELEDTNRKGLFQHTTAQLERGSQQITVSFPALNLYERMSVDGPYKVDRFGLNLEGDTQSSCCVDEGRVSSYTTGAYRRDDWDRGTFYGTTRVSGSGQDIKGDGKFQIYRVLWDVVTPGGKCSWGGSFSAKGAGDSQSIEKEAELPPGAARLDFDVDGYWIAKLGGSHPWQLSAGEVTCDGKGMPTTDSYSASMTFDTGVLRAEDFEAIPADFSFEPPRTPVILRAGGPQAMLNLKLHPVGQIESPVSVRVADLPEGVRAVAPDASIGHGFGYARVTFFARDTARPGEYPIRVVSAGAGREHELSLRLVIEAAAVPAKVGAIAPPGGRRSVALVLGVNGGLGKEGCEAMKQIARTFPTALQTGRDALTILEAGASVEVVLPLTADFQQTRLKLLGGLASLQCAGISNSVYALEKAEEQLQRPEARGSQRIVMLVASGLPSAIAASWPVRTQADSRKDPDGTENALPPSGCSDRQGRHFGDGGWASGDSMPNRTGVLSMTEFGPIGPLRPLDGSPSLPPSTVTPPPEACAFLGRGNSGSTQDFAYLPETDVGGIPLDGPQHLERFESGPYHGKIRPDSAANSQAALRNAFENVVRRLNGEGIGVFLLAVSPYDSPPAELNRVLNVPGSVGFDAACAAGFVVAIHDPEQVPRALSEVWASIGRAPKE